MENALQGETSGLQEIMFLHLTPGLTPMFEKTGIREGPWRFCEAIREAKMERGKFWGGKLQSCQAIQCCFHRFVSCPCSNLTSGMSGHIWAPTPPKNLPRSREASVKVPWSARRGKSLSWPRCPGPGPMKFKRRAPNHWGQQLVFVTLLGWWMVV